MNKVSIGLIFFAMGSAAGFITSEKLLKCKYEQLVQEEVDSVKAAFSKHEKSTVDKSKGLNRIFTPKTTKSERTNYRKLGESLKYLEKEEGGSLEMRPRIITPDEFGNQDGYDEISLTYYADETLTDDLDHPMDEDEIEETIGKGSLSHFGEYEADSVFVRNDRLKVDYEILMDQRTYAQILEEKPWLVR